MHASEQRACAVVQVQEREYRVLLDSGSHDANYVSEKVAKEIEGIRYNQRMNVRVGDGKVVETIAYIFIPIKLKVSNDLITEDYFKFFIFPDLIHHFVIGRADLLRHNLYGVMEAIDRRNVEEAKSDKERAVSGKEGGKTETEGEEDETWMTALDEVETTFADWGKIQNEAQEEKEFEEYIIKLRKEVNDMIDAEYSDLFATTPPAVPAKVWEQKLELIGEPINTPEGLKRVPAELRGMGRRIPLRYMEAARSQIEEMLRQNVIERSTSAISVPVQLTPKPNTIPLEMRFC